MTSLRELQEAMQAYVIEDDARVERAIVEPNDMSVAGRLNVYRNGYYLRLIEILETDFTALYKIMGQNDFAAMARDYLRAYPSHYFSVRSVGCHLSDFLAKREADQAYAELAAFEWAFNMALVSKEAECLTMQALAEFPQDQWLSMKLLLHPSVQCVTCQFNTMVRWRSLDSDNGDLAAVKYDKPLYHLLWRHNAEVYFCEISFEQYDLLQAIQRGESFSVLCERMLAHFEEDAVVEWVSQTLRDWVSEGVFAGVY